MNTQESSTQKVSRIYDKFKEKFLGNFHNALWQIIINERFKGKNVAFVQNFNNSGIELGIADKMHRGYTPTATMFDIDVKYDEAETIIDELNQDVFNLSPIEANEITLMSMRQKPTEIKLPKPQQN